MSLLTMLRGETVTFALALTDGDDVPLDLAGKGLTFTANRGGTTITKTIGAGITVTDEPGGLVEIEIEPDDTSDFEDRIVLAWNLSVTIGADVYTPLTGNLEIYPLVVP